MSRKKKAKRSSTIEVKVARTGGKTVEVVLNGGRSVLDALDAAGFAKKEAEEIHVNGEEVEEDYDLEDGDRVVLVKNVSGGKC